MKKHRKNVIRNKGDRCSKKLKAILRSTSVILSLVFVLLFCVGCASYASSDELEKLNADLHDAGKEIDSLKESYEAAQQTINALGIRDEETQKELSALKTENENAQQTITLLKNRDEAAQQRLEALEGSNKAAQEKIDALAEKNRVAMREIDSLKSDNAAMRQEIEKLKEQIRELQNGATPEEPVDKIKIYIDQGHNPTSYHNAGATGNGLYEQDLTYSIGILLAELLEEDGRFEIALSRPTADTVLGTDIDSSLDARVQGAKDFGADYFISLHINAYTDGTANGIEVYAAEQESVSYEFGNALLQGLIQTTNLRNRGMKLNPDLRVLKKATMPATLLEMGFISNSEDATLLSEHPELFAQGIYDGILDYFDLVPNDSSEN